MACTVHAAMGGIGSSLTCDLCLDQVPLTIKSYYPYLVHPELTRLVVIKMIAGRWIVQFLNVSLPNPPLPRFWAQSKVAQLYVLLLHAFLNIMATFM